MTPKTELETGPHPFPSGERLHALDAVRAFALLLGVVLHSALAYVMPPGQWGVGVAEPNLALWFFVYYTHDFRMQLFFLLAGFFAGRVVERRGARAFLRDRAVRIGLVFLVLLYPIKLLISLPWIAGGLKTGWLRLPPETAHLPLTVLAIGGLQQETWPAISPGHLWFLYYLLLVTALFLVARRLWQRLPAPRIAGGRATASRYLARMLTHPLAPLVLAVPVIPILMALPQAVLASPDRGFAPDAAALAIYGLFFAVGWWLSGRPELLGQFARRWPAWLTLSLLAALAAFAFELQIRTGSLSVATGLAGVAAHATTNALTLGFATLGWIGLFVDRFNAPSKLVRYLADASYWVYLAHLPIVVALQVWVVEWESLPLQLLTINAVTFSLTLVSYDLFVRDTGIGAWLNGRRHPRVLLRRAVGSNDP